MMRTTALTEPKTPTARRDHSPVRRTDDQLNIAAAMLITNTRTLLASQLGAIVQMPLVCGLYQSLRDAVGSAAFVWIRNLGRPDTILAPLAAVTTAAVQTLALRRAMKRRSGLG